jgi:hypothetical protein
MYSHTRTPVEDANVEAHFRASKPLVSNAGAKPRVMTAAIMGEWLRERQSVTEDDFRKEFTRAERERFEDEARDYALRRSGDLH